MQIAGHREYEPVSANCSVCLLLVPVDWPVEPGWTLGTCLFGDRCTLPRLHNTLQTLFNFTMHCICQETNSAIDDITLQCALQFAVGLVREWSTLPRYSLLNRKKNKLQFTL